MAAPLIRRRRVLAAKVETTPGTAETVTGTEAAFNVFNLEITPDITMAERKAQGSMSNLASIPTGRGATVTFDIEICGAGTSTPPPPWAATFLPSCGLVEGNGETYAPSSLPPEAVGSATKTVTLVGYYDGQRRAVFGAMGNVVFTFQAGQPVMARFTYRGVWGGVTDAAILTPTYPTVLPPRFANASGMLIASTPLKANQVTIDLGNVVTLREDSSVAAGYHSAVITDRNVTGTMDPESMLVAGWDAFGHFLAGTEAALALTVGTAQYNTQIYTIPKLQLIRPADGDRNGLQVDTWDFQANRSSANDDEFSLNFN